MKKLFAVLLVVLMIASLSLSVSAKGKNEPKIADDFESVFLEFPHDDGSVTSIYRDGGVVTQYADGSYEGVDGEGNRHTGDKDGTHRVYATDGSMAVEHPDGTRELVEKNGKKLVVNPDGSGKTVYGCGLVIEHNADMEQTVAYFEGGKERLTADENGDFPLGELKGKNGEILKNTEDGLYLKGANGAEYSFSDTNESASIVLPNGGSLKVEGGKAEMRFSDGATVTYTEDGTGKFIEPDGSYLYINQNSEAWEWFSAEDGTYAKVNENGELTDLKQKIGDIAVTVENGIIKDWKDPDAGVHIWSDENGTTVETPEGTYFTDGKGNVMKDGQPLNEETQTADAPSFDGYVKYSGRLTYTNGARNKHGQPWPDMMDFDGDGDIDYADRQIQHVLVHNPDAMDTPEGFALVMTALLASLIGAGGGSAFAILSGSLGSSGAGLKFNFAFPDSDDSSDNDSARGSDASEESEDAASASVPDQHGSGPEAKEDLGPYIRRDSDGDLKVTDPATGEERLYVANGNGTYSNPLTGATYTESELKATLENRADNAALLRKDAAAAKEAIAEQRGENQKKSRIAEEYEREKAALLEKEKQEEKHDAYVQKKMEEYGRYSEEGVREKIAAEKDQAEIEGYEQLEYEKEYQKSQKYAENVKKTADVAIDVLAEIEPTQVGKAIKDGYAVASSAASNAGDVMAGYKTVGGAMTQTVVDSGVELLKNHSEGVTEKLASNIMGDSIKAMSDEYMKGGSVEDIQKAGKGAAIQGGLNATADFVADGLGSKLGSESAESIGKVLGESVTEEAATEGAKALGADIVKDLISPDDPSEVAAEKAVEAREAAEKSANAEAAEHFRQSQKEWSERNKKE